MTFLSLRVTYLHIIRGRKWKQGS